MHNIEVGQDYAYSGNPETQTKPNRIKGRLTREFATIFIALNTIATGGGIATAQSNPDTSITPPPGIGILSPSPEPTPIASPSVETTPIPSESFLPLPSPTAEASAIISAVEKPLPTPLPPMPTPETLSQRDILLTPHLADVASNAGIDVGVEFTGWQFNDPEWQKTVGEQFNLAIIDWGLYWKEIEPTKGVFDFSTMDKEIAFAKKNGMKIRGEPLIIPNSSLLPDWLKNGNLSASQLTKIIQNHVRSIVGHYKGIVNEWVVVEEPYKAPYFTDDIFYKTLGYRYIDIAFKAAREADPSAILIYGDDHNHSSKGGQNGFATQLTQDTVKRLRSKGLIDAVALEMHIDASNPPGKKDVIKTMRSYGLPIIVSSFDVNLQKIKGTKKQRYALQAQIASDMVTACTQSKVCTDFSVWGIGDQYTYQVQGGEIKADPSLFDNNLNPKPAYFAIREALSQTSS